MPNHLYSRRYIALAAMLLLRLLSPVLAEAQLKTVTHYADPASDPPDLMVTLKHLTADVAFRPEENRVIGTARFEFLPNRYVTDSIVFHCPDFSVSSVTVEGAAARYYQRGPALVILTASNGLVKGKSSSLTIRYEATPGAGPIYFIGWRPEEAGKRKAVWAHRSQGWLPYMDARITADIRITFDSRYAVFSNGERISVKENRDQTKTWHYAMKRDHPFFSTALVIGEYDYVASKTSRGTPLEYWYYRGMADRVPVTYKYTEQMFDFFEKELGVNYPYPVYREAPVIDYMYGAMETTTSTVFGDYMLIEPRAWWQRNYVNVNAHELAHQWFGNYVGHLVNRDVWLTESFGTYYAKLFERSVYGEDYYQGIRHEEFLQSFDAARRNNYPVGGSQGGVQRIYQKGSLVLDMLRDVMGEREFRDAVKLYLERYGFGYAQTSDFIRCVYDVTGKSYQWFFDQWVLRGGEPWYQVSYSVVDDTLGKRSTWVEVSQIHETDDLVGLFSMPVNIEVHYTDGTSDHATVRIDQKVTQVRIANPGKKRPSFILFDPGRKILKRLTFNRSPEELLAQFRKADAMIDRYDALLVMKPVPIHLKRTSLCDAFKKERFSLIRNEILQQLSGDTTHEVVALFGNALGDADANVRKVALQELEPVPLALQPAVEACLYDSSWLNIELALNALCTSFPERRSLYLEQTSSMEGWRGKNIRMKWLELSLANGQVDKLEELILYTGPRYEFETRINAFGVLRRIKYSDPVVLLNARNAAKHWNNKLSSAAREYLKYFE